MDAMLRRPSSLDGAAGEPGRWSGRARLESSYVVPPSGDCSMTISVAAPVITITVSRNSPSTLIFWPASKPMLTK